MEKVDLNNGIKTLEVFYDGRCGMCRTYIEWLEKQERTSNRGIDCEIICLGYQSDEAKRVFPDLADYHPEKEMVVRVDGMAVYQGGEGWVCCLWSCAKYCGVAEKMNSSLLLPMAKKVCYLISKNRFTVSKLFFRKKNEEIAAGIEKAEMEHGNSPD